MRTTTMFRAAALVAVSFFLGCGGGEPGGEAGDGGELTGEIEIDGSSTVYPVAEAAAEEFQLAHPRARVTVGQSGTGGGFKRFCAGETDVSDASRPITEDERESCRASGVDFLELPIAWDGLSVVTNPANDFAQCLTMEELRRVWEPASQIETWRDLRSEWPDTEIELYGPGTDSGTFDYFTEEVVGESGASRADFQASEDDNILVQGVAGDENSLGYFGYAYYVENEDRLQLLGVDGGEGCVRPSDETIESGAYPLSRPLFLYVSRASLQEPTVREFMEFTMENAHELVVPTGYHALSEAMYQQNLDRIAGRTGAGQASGEAEAPGGGESMDAEPGETPQEGDAGDGNEGSAPSDGGS